MRKAHSILFLTLIWAGLTALVLTLPGEMLPWTRPWWLPSVLEPGLDKLVHFGLFAVLAALFVRLLKSRRSGRTWLAALAVCLPYALILELSQIWVAGRSFDPWDLTAAAMGVLLAVVLLPA